MFLILAFVDSFAYLLVPLNWTALVFVAILSPVLRGVEGSHGDSPHLTRFLTIRSFPFRVGSFRSYGL